MRRHWPIAVCASLGLATAVIAQGGRTPSSASAKASADTLNVLESSQATTLPSLPSGMRLDHIRHGDALFRGKAGCATCHGGEAEGMPDAGSPLTAGLHFVQPQWPAVQTLIRCGLGETTTRSSEAMPARGAESNLTDDEIRHVAAYVWAISQTRGEPWPGGHQLHGSPEAHDSKPGEGKPHEQAAMKAEGQAAMGGGHGAASNPLVRDVSAGCPQGSAPAAKGGHGAAR